jgi:hypothetical protein
MKYILIPLIWLMFPIAFVVIAYEVAKEAAENELQKRFQKAKLKEKNGY